MTHSPPQIETLSLFPEMFQALNFGIVGQALSRELFTLRHWQLRDFSTHSDGRVDDRPYGGGGGMVLSPEPILTAFSAIQAQQPCHVVMMSPAGQPINRELICHLQDQSRLLILCGRYEGIDHRVLSQVDCEVSVGDFVVSGGELPAMLLIDAWARWLPGALGCADGAMLDSFSADLLEHPHYTRPFQLGNASVPEVLAGGNHQAIAKWRQTQSLGRTWWSRPELLTGQTLTGDQLDCLQTYMREICQPNPEQDA